MRVFDVFPYWREEQFVQARHLLWSRYQPDVQHTTVALVGDRTHRGDPLPADLPEPGAHRVIKVTLDAEGDWGREHQQRDAIVKHLRQWLVLGEAAPDDLVIIADADELTDPRRHRAIVSATMYRPTKLGMQLYLYGLDWRARMPWWQAAAGRVRDIVNLNPSTLRTASFGYPVVSDSGWHCSYLGGTEGIDQKLKAFAHSEWDTDANRVIIDDNRLQGKDMRGQQLLHMPMEQEIAQCLTSIPRSVWS